MYYLKTIKKLIKTERVNSPNTFGVIFFFKVILKIYYNKFYNFYIEYKKDSTFNRKEDIFMCSLFPQKVLDIIINELNPKSLLDIGCGTGVSLGYFIENDVKATGVENSKIAISSSKYKDSIIHFNLKNELNLNKKFDLVWCFEVIEHIHPD